MDHLKGIGVKNFRVFKEETTFNLTPITILTGPNNSGKSSLIKLIKLLNENLNSDNRLNNLQFYIGTHSLGSYKSVISWNSESEKIEIDLPFPLRYFDEQFKIKLIYVPTLENMGILDSFKVYNKNRILVEFYNNPSLELAIPYQEEREKILKNNKSDFKLNQVKLIKNLDYTYLIKTAFELKVKGVEMIEALKREKAKHDNNIDKEDESGFTNIIFDDSYNEHFDLQSFLCGNTTSVFDEFYTKYLNMPGWDEIEKFIDIYDNQMLYDFYKENKLVNDNINYKEEIERQNERILNNLKHCPISFEYEIILNRRKNTFEWFYEFIKLFTKEMKNIGAFNIEISNLGKIVFEDLLLTNFKKTIDEIEQSFKSIHYLSVNRGDQSRLYSMYGNMELNELLIQFDELFKNHSEKFHIENFINKYLQQLSIGVKLNIIKIEDAAFTIKIQSQETGNDISLSDLGFGYSQMIPILLKIATLALRNTNFDMNNSITGYSPSIFLLEEPEANLHPNFQSKLADIFVDAGKRFNIQFIIETHSEYLIRKLQYLTAKKEIKPEDSVIYYFNHPNEVAKGAEQVKEIKILDDGSLSDDFGPGFFDEATNLKFDLLRLKNSQKN